MRLRGFLLIKTCLFIQGIVVRFYLCSCSEMFILHVSLCSSLALRPSQPSIPSACTGQVDNDFPFLHAPQHSGRPWQPAAALKEVADGSCQGAWAVEDTQAQKHVVNLAWLDPVSSVIFLLVVPNPSKFQKDCERQGAAKKEIAND